MLDLGPQTPAARAVEQAVAAAMPLKLPGSLNTNRRLNQWLSFNPDRTVSVRTGKVEIGQGIITGLAIIAAEELDVPVSAVRVIPATTASGPAEGVTSGSQSIQQSGMAVRHACAEARRIALEKAARAWNMAPAALRVVAGDFLRADASVVGNYWQTLAAADLDVEVSGGAVPKSPADFTLVGKGGMPRLDLKDKLFGMPRFVHDLRPGGMVHGRVVRPPSRPAQLLHVAPERAMSVPGVLKVVVDGRFLGVVANSEHAAEAGAAALASACEWREVPDMPDPAALTDFLRESPAVTTVPHDTTGAATAGARPGGLSHHQRAYLKPFIAHASIAPSCGLALWNGTALEVWTNSQGIHNLRDDLVTVLAQGGQCVEKEQITIHHVEGAGAYGHNGADDVACDAVLLALAWPHAPVRVLWSRADELTWSPLGAAHLVQIEAETDANGMLRHWNLTLWANGYMCRPGRNKVPTLLAAGHRTCGVPPPIAINMPFATGGGADRNAIPIYDIPSVKVTNHRLDVMPVRTSSIRALGAFANVFAIESFMDEVALSLQADPVEFRRRHLQHDPRALATIDTVLEHCDWWSVPRAERGEGVGHGFAIARYKHFGAWCAVAVRVEATDRVRVTHIDIAVDVGQIIDRDGVINQTEGSAIQSASWALLEQMPLGPSHPAGIGWDTYPIMRFTDVPRVKVHLIDRPEQPPLGAGEMAQGPVAGALGNAVADALGVRVRTLPLTFENIASAMD